MDGDLLCAFGILPVHTLGYIPRKTFGGTLLNLKCVLFWLILGGAPILDTRILSCVRFQYSNLTRVFVGWLLYISIIYYDSYSNSVILVLYISIIY